VFLKFGSMFERYHISGMPRGTEMAVVPYCSLSDLDSGGILTESNIYFFGDF
jgi:hypothetical protein